MVNSLLFHLCALVLGFCSAVHAFPQSGPTLDFNPETSYFPQRDVGGSSVGGVGVSEDSFLSPPPPPQPLPPAVAAPAEETPLAFQPPPPQQSPIANSVVQEGRQDSYLNSHFSNNVAAPLIATGGNAVGVGAPAALSGHEYGEIVPAPFSAGVDSYAAYANFRQNKKQ